MTETHEFTVGPSAYDLAFICKCSCGYEIRVIRANPKPGINVMYAHINEMRKSVQH